MSPTTIHVRNPILDPPLRSSRKPQRESHLQRQLAQCQLDGIHLLKKKNLIASSRRERMFPRVPWVISRIALSLLAVAFLASACSKFLPDKSAEPVPGQSVPHPTIVFMSDFGVANDAVAICKAVIVGIAPDARIMDITHQVTPYSIEEGARFLLGVTPYYASGTVFLVVVGSGVDHHEKDRAGSIVRRHAQQKTRAFLDRIGRHLMGDVHDAGVGGDADNHGFADGHCVVGDAEVAHEDNGRMRDGLPRNGLGAFVGQKLGAGARQESDREQRQSNSRNDPRNPRKHPLSPGTSDQVFFLEPVYSVQLTLGKLAL